MIKAIVVSRYPEDILPLLKKYGIKVITHGTADVVISYGGDGSLLRAEREYVSIPKLPIRDIRTAKLCKHHSLESIIRAFSEGLIERTKMVKLVANFQEKTIFALNDIFIHNYNRVSAIRYQIIIDGELYSKETVSDSFGIATPHGSTAYFRSITGTIFRVGIGLAFSNSRGHEDHMVISEDSKIEIKLIRGPAMMVADNSPEIIPLNSGDEITICKGKEDIIVFGLNEFMCPDCRALRHKKK